jgi:hypothetical protein
VGGKSWLENFGVNLTGRLASGLPDATQDPGFTPQGERDPYNIGPQRNVRVGLELRR